MNLPRRRKREPMGLREEPQIRCASHLSWIRGHCCSVDNAECSGKIEAAHVRICTDGGTSVKPGDNWTLPLCSHHHAQQHQIGERSFASVHKLDMKATAAKLWQISPHRHKYEAKNNCARQEGLTSPASRS